MPIMCKSQFFWLFRLSGPKQIARPNWDVAEPALVPKNWCVHVYGNCPMLAIYTGHNVEHANCTVITAYIYPLSSGYLFPDVAAVMDLLYIRRSSAACALSYYSPLLITALRLTPSRLQSSTYLSSLFWLYSLRRYILIFLCFFGRAHKYLLNFSIIISSVFCVCWQTYTDTSALITVCHCQCQCVTEPEWLTVQIWHRSPRLTEFPADWRSLTECLCLSQRAAATGYSSAVTSIPIVKLVSVKHNLYHNSNVVVISPIFDHTIHVEGHNVEKPTPLLQLAASHSVLV